MEEPRSLAGYSPWGRKESDTTEQLMPSLFIVVLEQLYKEVNQLRDTYSPPPGLPHTPASPLWVITGHWAELHVLHSGFPRAALHVVMCICQA